MGVVVLTSITLSITKGGQTTDISLIMTLMETDQILIDTITLGGLINDQLKAKTPTRTCLGELTNARVNQDVEVLLTIYMFIYISILHVHPTFH